MSKQIPLTKGKFAIVDDEDYEWLSQWKWYANKGGNTYYAERGNRKKVFVSMHRLILGLKHGDRKYSDHINHNGLDNRRCNLRPCTFQQNLQHQQKRPNCSSKYKGITWYKSTKKWVAQIRNNKGERIYLGCFDNEVKAAKYYDKKAREVFGEFAWLNFPKEH